MDRGGERQSLLTSMPAEWLNGTWRFATGMALLGLVILEWTASNFVTNQLETGTESWNKPFLITWLNDVICVLWLFPYLYRHMREGSKRRSSASVSSAPYEPVPLFEAPASPRTSASLTRARQRSRSPLSALASHSHPQPSAPEAVETFKPLPHHSTTELLPLTLRQTAELSAWWSVVWFVANWALNAGLAFTSVASVTICSTTSSFFTLGLGRLFGVDVLSTPKILATIISFLGVVLVTTSDSAIPTTGFEAAPIESLPARPLLGDALILFSAFLFGVYIVYIKVKVGQEERADMQLILGFAGLYVTVAGIPIFVLLHYTGIETFALPPNKSAWLAIGFNMLITLTSDWIYMLAMLRTSPTIAAIGLCLTVPLTLVLSPFIPGSNGHAITLLSLAGAAMVLGSFAILGWEGWQDSKLETIQVDEDRGRSQISMRTEAG